jgi:hypothetical protein
MQETEGNHHPFISHTKTLSHITFSAIEKNLILLGLPVPLTTSSLIITELISDPGISN